MKLGLDIILFFTMIIWEPVKQMSQIDSPENRF